MKIIKAKFASKCASTGLTIKKGESIAYDYNAKKAYCSRSEQYQKAEKEQADRSINSYIEDQLEAGYYRQHR
jgi:hypothetical protein